MNRRHRRPPRARRGAIFILALGVVVILSGLVLVFAQSMRTEAVSSGNRLSAMRADAIEQGAEYWMLAEVENYRPDALTITQLSAAGMPIGDPNNPAGYFWLLYPDPTTDQTPGYGIQDEAAKLNLNVVSSANSGVQLINLPNMTQELAQAITDWRTPGGGAGEAAYYTGLGYQSKGANFESVEELRLVEGFDTNPSLLYGEDLNQDGVVDAAEQAIAGGQTSTLSNLFNGAGTVSTRGWAGDFTVWSKDINRTNTLGTRISVRSDAVGTPVQTTRLTSAMTKAGITSARANQIIQNLYQVIAARRGRRGPPAPASYVTKYRITSLGSFFNHSQMTVPEFKLVADKLTAAIGTTSILPGLINVNTAPKEVLMCLPGLQPSDADSLISQRNNESDLSTIAWVFDALTKDKAAGILNYITARSYVYSADIVAVSADGRSFKRVKIVVDGTPVNGQLQPAKIVFRRDLTALGWPLDPAIRTALRSGQKLPPPVEGTGPGVSGNLGL